MTIKNTAFKAITRLEEENQQLKQRIEQLEQIIKNQRDTINLFTDNESAREQLDQRDIEQQIKALEDLRESVCLEWWSDNKVHERIEQLRKGGE